MTREMVRELVGRAMDCNLMLEFFDCLSPEIVHSKIRQCLIDLPSALENIQCERDELRDSLRHYVIREDRVDEETAKRILVCLVCSCEWESDGPELHLPSCLARPRYGKQQ